MFKRFFNKNLMSLVFALAFGFSAHAGPEEDYQAGLKSFRDGDVVGAMAPLKSASDAGHPKALSLYAEVLARAEFEDEALVLYKKAAELGDLDGMLGYGTMLASGDRNRRQKDPLQGRAWIEKAAELGHGQSIKVLAQSYMRMELGLTEADRNSETAYKWIDLAAKLDYLPAVDTLYRAYRQGGALGLSADPKMAEQYLSQANRLRGVDPSKNKRKSRKSQVATPMVQETK